VIEKTFEVGAAPEVVVRIESGRIEIVEGPTRQVKAIVETKDPGFIVEQRGDSILLQHDPEAGWLSSKRTDVFLEVPPGASATLRTASADVSAQVALDKVEVKTASGDVDLDEAAKVVIKTASGDTAVEEVTEALRFTSASGGLQAERVTGSIVASTASGDIAVEEAEATTEVNTVSGDVRLHRFLGRHLVVKSMSGSIDVGIPSGTKVDLDASLMSGRLLLPPAAEATTVVDRHISVKVKSVSGNLTIERLPG
jgi:DUF4097 and DUF4098 domain-containing protein YvlB